MESNKSHRKIWQPGRFWLPIGGFIALVVGVLVVFSFNTTMTYTNSNEFCYSCHLQIDTIVQEYKASSHFKNQAGVGATCADCHVPKAFIPKMKVKIIAMKDVYHMLMGTVTKDNFEQHRNRLAQSVWNTMIANESAECKSCHDPEKWDLEMQPSRARLKHDPKDWQERQESCIDCHYGLAHKRPEV